MKRLDWYIIRKFLGTFFFSIVLILSIAIVFDLTEKMDDFFENQVPLREIIFDYYLPFIPYYMNMFSSLFIFISVIRRLGTVAVWVQSDESFVFVIYEEDCNATL